MNSFAKPSGLPGIATLGICIGMMSSLPASKSGHFSFRLGLKISFFFIKACISIRSALYGERLFFSMRSCVNKLTTECKFVARMFCCVGVLFGSESTLLSQIRLDLIRSSDSTSLFRIMENGKVGISNINPEYMLDITGDTRLSSNLVIGPGTNKVLWFNRVDPFYTRAQVAFIWDGSNNKLDMSLIDGTSNMETARMILSQDNSIQMRTSNMEAVRINSSGFLGLGVTNPLARLHVGGIVKATGLDISGTTVFSSPVGIGTSPEGSSHLHVAGNVTLNTNNQLKLDSGSGTSMLRYNSTGSLTEFFCYPAGGFAFYQGGTPLVRIQSTGNVGVGTTSPAHKMDIAGDFRSNNDMTVGPGTNKSIWFNRNESSYTRARIGFLFNGTNNRLDLGLIDGTSNVESAGLAMTQDSTIQFRIGTTEMVKIDKSGNMGIGEINPTNILTIKQNSSSDPVADSWTTYSSARWKYDILTLSHVLENLVQLRGVSYRWRADDKPDIGFIAEEVARIYPEIVAFEPGTHEAISMDYSRLVPVLVEAIKEQQQMLAYQEMQINKLIDRIARMEMIK